MNKWLLGCFLLLSIGFYTLSFPFFKAAYIFFGFIRPQEYIVLLQNNYELRPSGGFMGSYARIRFDAGRVSLQKIQDIYVPDGQIEGHVDPPYPIQAAFGQGWYRLRDSNWDPDFPISARTILWFFEKGDESKADGLIAVDLSVFAHVLQVIGDIHVPDGGVLTTDSFYAYMQTAVEQDFFPGSIQKTHYLSQVGKQSMEQLKSLRPEQILMLGVRGFSLLSTKDIMLYHQDSQVESIFHRLHWDGSIHRLSATDYLAFFEANLGANKANCCIKRSVRLDIESNRSDPSHLQHTLTLSYTNNNLTTLKQPPKTWGGAYLNFLQIVLPSEAVVESVHVGDRALIQGDDRQLGTYFALSEHDWQTRTATASALQIFSIRQRQDEQLQTVGFFVPIDAQQREDVHIVYTVPKKTAWFRQSLWLQKQGGIDPYLFQLRTDGNTQAYTVRSDMNIAF